MLSNSISVLTIIFYFIVSISSSPLHLSARDSESEKLAKLCNDATQGFSDRGFYNSHAIVSKSTSVGGSRVGAKILICTAYFECDIEEDYSPGRAGADLRVWFASNQKASPQKDWQISFFWRNPNGDTPTSCKLGVSRKTGYGISVPKDIGQPSNKPSEKSKTSSTSKTSKPSSTGPKSGSTGPKPFIIPTATTEPPDVIPSDKPDVVTSDKTPLSTPASQTPSSNQAHITSSPTSSTSSTTTPAPAPTPVPVIADINADIAVAQSNLDNLFKNLDDQGAIFETLIALGKAEYTAKEVAKRASHGLLNFLHGLVDSLKSVRDIISSANGKITDDIVEKIKAGKEDIKGYTDSTNKAPSADLSPSLPSTTSSQPSQTSGTATESECPLSTIPSEPVTHEITDPTGEWGFFTHSNSTETNDALVERSLERDRTIRICGIDLSSAPPFESWHKHPTNAGPNRYTTYYTHRFQWQYCRAKATWSFTEGTAPLMSTIDYATEHIYELQLLNQFLLWLGWNDDNVARELGLPTNSETKANMNEAEHERYGHLRKDQFCSRHLQRNLLTDYFTHQRWTEHPFGLPTKTEKVINALLREMSSDARDQAASTQDKEFVYLDSTINGLKTTLLQRNTPTTLNNWEDKLEKLAAASSLFTYLGSDPVARIWGRVSWRVHGFYKKMDNVKTEQARIWPLGRTIQWADSYAHWEQEFLKDAERLWKEWFVLEINAVSKQVKKSGNKFMENDLKIWNQDVDGGPGKLSVNRISLEYLRGARERYQRELDMAEAGE